jgi:FdhD protein
VVAFARIDRGWPPTIMNVNWRVSNMNGRGCTGEYAHSSAHDTSLNEGVYAAARTVHRQIWREGRPSVGNRSIPEEAAVALTYNGGTYAVMMTTPQDLEDFAVGFSLTEGVINCPADIESLDIVRLDDGIELRMWIAEPKAERLRERQRHIAGPTGCGLCGIESIAEAIRPAAVVRRGRQFSPEHIMVAMQSLPLRQKLNIETRAVHAAAFWNVTGGIVALREDVGRHNALDKLSGALARASIGAGEGIILLTSRVSVEMVQKSAAIGAPVMVSVSAPTALAVRMADASGITLAAIARADGFEVFTHPSRIASGAADNTAITVLTRWPFGNLGAVKTAII